jgi:hypothetical protein
MAEDYYYRNDPRAPCRPENHNFAMNGRCWQCDHSRNALLRDAKELLEMYGWEITKKKKKKGSRWE